MTDFSALDQAKADLDAKETALKAAINARDSAEASVLAADAEVEAALRVYLDAWAVHGVVPPAA